MKSPLDAEPRPHKRPRLRVSLATALVGGIALVIVIAVGSVLVMGVIGAGRNTVALLLDKVDLGLNLLEREVAGQLRPVEQIAVTLAGQLSDGSLSLNRPKDLRAASEAALKNATQFSTLIYLVDGFAPWGMYSAPVGLGVIEDLTRDDERVKLALDVARVAEGATWYSPLWIEESNAAVISVLVPVGRGGDYNGVVIASVSLARLSEALAAFGVTGATRTMILYDNDYVLAHPALPTVDASLFADWETPLPRLSHVDPDAQGAIDEDRVDSAEEAAEEEEDRTEFMQAIDRPQMADVRGFGNRDWTLLIRDLEGYGEAPLQIALLYSNEIARPEIQRVGRMAAVGFVILLIAVVLGTLIGRRVTRRVRGLSEAAEHLRVLDVASVETLPPSHFRELDSAAQSINALTAAMTWFETYVPKTLVERLMRQGARFALSSREREMTVMFTDIRGFSGIAEEMAPDDVADMLNGHFDLIAGCIEAEGGTVDKFMGDGVMAFWGAPEDQEDHAARAFNAARAVVQALGADNAERRAVGLPRLSVGVGVHTGRVIVGNIGSRSRVNYTVVGDPVNIASRLEEMAKTLEPRDACIVLVSDTTRNAAGTPDDLAHLGQYQVKGRRAPIDVYRLTVEDA